MDALPTLREDPTTGVTLSPTAYCDALRGDLLLFQVFVALFSLRSNGFYAPVFITTTYQDVPASPGDPARGARLCQKPGWAKRRIDPVLGLGAGCSRLLASTCPSRGLLLPPASLRVMHRYPERGTLSLSRGSPLPTHWPGGLL